MNIKEKIKSIIGEANFAAIENLLKTAFAEVVAKDGSVLKYEGDLKEGTALFISTPDGDVAVPDGVIELEDGTMVECAAGVVVTITPKAADPNEPTADNEMTAEKMAGALTDLTTKLEALTAKVAELETKFSAPPADDINTKIEEAINGLKASTTDKLKSDFAVMLQLVNEIAELPIGEPKEKTNGNFSTAKEKREKTILALSKALNSK